MTTSRTKRGLRIAGAAAILASVSAAELAVAQQQGDALSVDVSECVKLATPEERLACFEAQVEAAGGASAPSGAPAAASGAAAAGSASRSGSPQEPVDPPDIVARVTELRETVPNAYLITLDNGQVWRQKVPEVYPLREGSLVRIYYSRWRTYRLTNEELRGFIQVERAR